MSNQEIAKQLQKRTIGKSETLMQYFITMRNIAQQGNFDEVDVVKYIVDGLEDHSGRAAPLYYCITLDELKLMRFQSVRLESNRKAVTMIPRPKDTRCYNCRQMGHTAKDCKKPKRPDNGCFICFEVGHMHRQCPKVKSGGIYSLKIDIKYSGVSNSIICMVFSNILVESRIVYLPVANSNC